MKTKFELWSFMHVTIKHWWFVTLLLNGANPFTCVRVKSTIFILFHKYNQFIVKLISLLTICIYSLTVNVALNKPAYQQYQWNPGDSRSDARNGVDGHKSKRTLAGGQCVVSADNQQTATWRVNLTSVHSIHHITIYYRTGGVKWGRL